MNIAARFFYDNAGYSYPPDADAAGKDAARRECAERLARAEAWASERGYTFSWEHEQGDWTDFLGDEQSLDDVSEVLCVVMRDADGNVVQSLGGVQMGHDQAESRAFCRVCEAELAREEMP